DADTFAWRVEADEVQPFPFTYPKLSLYLPAVARGHRARGHHLPEGLHLRALDLDKAVMRYQSIRGDSDIVVPGMHDESDLLHDTAARLGVPAPRMILVVHAPLHGGVDIPAILASTGPALLGQLVDQVPIAVRMCRCHGTGEAGAGNAAC